MMSRAALATSVSILLLAMAFFFTNAPAAAADDQADARESLLEADRAISRIYHDRDAFAEFIAPDVWNLPPDGPRVQGRDDFLDTVAAFVAMDLEFGPDVVMVSDAGDFGVSIGTFQMNVPTPDGEIVRRTGKYQSTWRRESDGHWQMVADMFNFDAPM